VEREKRDAVGDTEHGLDELEGWRAAGEEGCLELAFAELGCGDGVCDDASADAHLYFAVGREGEGADGDAEGGVSVGREQTDAAGADGARGGFELAQDLHGAEFGSAGDGAAGEEGAEDVVGAQVGAELAGDGGGHLQERGVALDGEGVCGADGAHAAETAEVVAEKVENHDVLGAVLGVEVEGVGERFVFGGVEAAGHGSLHGAGGDAVGFDAEEEFGGEREDVAAGEVEQRGVGDGLRAEEMVVQRGGRGGGAGSGVEREVGLVGVSGGDEGLDAADESGVGGFVEAEGEIGDGGFGFGRGGRESGRRRGEEAAGGVVEDVRGVVDAEPADGVGRAGKIEVGEVFEVVAALVVEVSGGVVAAGEGGIQCGEERGEFVERVRGVGGDGREAEVAAMIIGVEAGGLEENGVGSCGGERTEAGGER